MLNWFVQNSEPIVDLDALIYVGNLANWASLAAHSGHHFVRGGIKGFDFVTKLLAQHQPRTFLDGI